MIQELTSIPIGDLIRSMAMAIADAQLQLDRASVVVAEMMSGQHPLRDRASLALIDGAGATATEPVMVDSRVYFGHHIEEGRRVPDLVSMIELGFVPNFYQFVDTVIEVRLALQVRRGPAAVDPKTGQLVEGAATAGPGRVELVSTPVDAGYASSYGYHLEMSSVFKTKLACVPPPAGLEERLRQRMLLEARSAIPQANTAERGAGLTMPLTDKVLSFGASGAQYVTLGQAKKYQDDYGLGVGLWIKPGARRPVPIFGIGDRTQAKVKMGALGLSITAEGYLKLEAWGAWAFTGTTKLAAGIWYHVGFSLCNGWGQIALYTNGRGEGGSGERYLGAPPWLDETVVLGKNLFVPDVYFDGCMTEARFLRNIWGDFADYSRSGAAMPGQHYGYFPLDADPGTRTLTDQAVDPAGAARPTGTITGAVFVANTLNLKRPSATGVVPHDVVVGDFDPASGTEGGHVTFESTSWPPNSASLTVEAWVRPTGQGRPPHTFPVVSKHSVSKGWELRAGAGTASFLVTIGGVYSVVECTISPSRWTHLAAVHDSITGKLSLFANGKLQSTINVSGAITESPQPLCIGRNSYWPAHRYAGQIAEVRIWNVARTEAEIQATLWPESRLTAPQTGLVGLYRLEGDATSGINPGVNDGIAKNMLWTGGALPLPASVDSRTALTTQERARTNAALLPENQTLQSTNGELTASLSQKATELAGLEASVASLDADVARLTRLAGTLTTERDGLAGQPALLEAKQAKLLELETEYTRLQSDRAQLSLQELVTSASQKISLARKKLGAAGSNYALGRVSIEVKMLPGSNGVGLKLPTVDEMKELRDSRLSTLTLDLEARDDTRALPPTLATPSVLGYTEVIARRKLADAGLEALTSFQAVAETSEEHVLADRVVNQIPRPGDEIPRGSGVTIFVGRSL